MFGSGFGSSTLTVISLPVLGPQLAAGVLITNVATAPFRMTCNASTGFNRYVSKYLQTILKLSLVIETGT